MSLATTFDPITTPARMRATQNGFELEQCALVTGYNASTYPTVAQFQQAAVNFVNLPLGTQLNPTICANCYLEEWEASPFVPGQQEGVLIKYIYRQRCPVAKVSVGGMAEQSETCYDINHALMPVSQVVDGVTKTDNIHLPKFVPHVTRVVTRLETITASNLEAKALGYLGYYNSSTWFGYTEGKWLCIQLSGQSNNGGVTFEVTYGFAYNVDGWKYITGVWLDPKTGRMPAVPGTNAVKQFQIYGGANFGSLNL